MGSKSSHSLLPPNSGLKHYGVPLLDKTLDLLGSYFEKARELERDLSLIKGQMLLCSVCYELKEPRPLLDPMQVLMWSMSAQFNGDIYQQLL